MVLLLAWTLFVWVGRIRNALDDADLTGAQQRGSLLLAASFVVPALVLVVVLFSSARGVSSARGARGVGPVLRYGVLALAVWTCAVWVVRIVDIAFGGDWDVAFVVVHAVLAVVSAALAVGAARAVLGAGRVAPVGAGVAVDTESR